MSRRVPPGGSGRRVSGRGILRFVARSRNTIVNNATACVSLREETRGDAYEAYRRKDDPERDVYLRALQDANEARSYRSLLDHIEEMTPLVYTPVVAQRCQQLSHIDRRARGLLVSYRSAATARSEPSWATRSASR